METMSTATAQLEYAALLARTLPAVIHSEKENERCIAMLETLDRKEDRKPEKLTAAERRLAELLTVLIEDFEEEAYALKPARPVEVLRELIESNGLKQKDLLDVFRTPSIASEVLREKRALTVEHIRKLSRRFHVSPEVFF
jgi:HTH-type transcriptional regulator/antitoxin HigA